MLDLRIPSGFFFVAIGLILMTMGVLNPADRAPLTETNVNLYAGAVMFGFGAFLLLLSRRKA
jgi:uncharacterized membrane protein